MDKAVLSLLLAAENPILRSRLETSLAAGGVPFTKSELGIEVACIGRDWEQVVRDLCERLSLPERQDTRVAVIDGRDEQSIFHAVFKAVSLEGLMGRIRESWLKDVLKRDALEIHLQPLVQFPPGRLHGYECLLRGRDREGKLIPPNRLFEAAKSMDMLFELDQRARLASVKKIAQVNLPDAQFFINFLPTAIYNPDHCLEKTMAAIDASGVNPAQITFEVVETEQVVDRKHLAKILRFYRDKGFKVALDDVGAGYSSLLALSELRPDYIKLDMELVRRAVSSSLEARIVRDLADAARQHGIVTIAEGLETEEHVRFVLSSGIRITQGYFHARPQAEPLAQEQISGIFERIGHVASCAA